MDLPDILWRDADPSSPRRRFDRSGAGVFVSVDPGVRFDRSGAGTFVSVGTRGVGRFLDFFLGSTLFRTTSDPNPVLS